ncbi:MAG: glycosyltransferase family 2 protein [Bacteroidales bacterium]|nr:glycosyltransferase family 2 protein [Bacteroidales bacterium]
MKLSVVIVNYNVKYFLEQCLNSVRRASEGLQVEVFVVDNNSVDGSCEMVREKFPEVIQIENKENLGFSKANNQAILQSKGEYVLLLNPDTVVEDDTFSKVLEFMDNHPDAGGLGVKMIDGKGTFLPESKRGLPTPDVAFYKIFGLSKFFPRSKIFGKYHLGYLPQDDINPVDVLSGAFMLLRRETLDKTGLLDETFFMYGEDIDLSYRILKAGYKNYYFPGTRIIHYKGESTKKGSINYVFLFYNAMIIFARKHFTHRRARILALLIRIAIYFRASLAIVSRFLSKAIMPLLDAILIYGGLFFIINYWEERVIFPEGGGYPPGFFTLAVPGYILIWLLSCYFSSTYDRPVKIGKIFRGISVGTVIILVAYALLPEHLRFSRAIILLGAVWAVLAMAGLRIFSNLVKSGHFGFDAVKDRRFVIIGDLAEAKRVRDLLQNSYRNPGFIGMVAVNAGEHKSDELIGSLPQIKEIIKVYRIDEIIFCSKSMTHQAIIDQMSDLQDLQVDYKIAPEDSLSIIGSNSINTAGDLYTVNINAITNVENLRNKRLLDLAVSLGALIMLPVLLFLVQSLPGLLRNILRVLFGCRSWVGYVSDGADPTDRLPHIRKGILNPMDAFGDDVISDEIRQQLNVIYTRDYSIRNDLNIILKGIRNLGRKN